MDNIVFTEDQERIIQEAVDWYHNSSEQTFQFAGEAGTGKSVVLNEIVRRLRMSPEEVMPMAFTGQAAIVMRLKGFKFARSIHSSLYRFDYIAQDFMDAYNVDQMYNRPRKEKIFRPKSPDEIPSYVKLFVIDEGYMVPKNMRSVIDSFGKKVLVAGDDGQLPPVSGEPAYFVDGNVRRLTQLMRQAETNPIIYIAHRARLGLPIHCGRYGDNVLVIEDRDLTDQIISIPQAIVCGTNATRDMFNKYIRERIRGIHSDLPVYGERMICRDNNWQIERDYISLANGLVGTVVNSPGIGGFNGRNFKMDFLPDLSNSVFDNLDVDYKYYKAPYEERKDLKFDKYTTGEKFEFAYALTSYLCQGSEYHTTMYIEEFLRSNIQNQLNYSSVTRAKQNLIYVKKSKRFYSFFS
jgi:hypothetical protein